MHYTSVTTSNDPDFDLLTRWLLGEATPQEAARVQAWRDADPARAKQLVQLSQRWHAVGETPLPDSSGQWEAMRQRLTLPAPVASSHRPATRRFSGWRVAALGGVGCIAVATVAAIFGGAFRSMTPEFHVGATYTTQVGELLKVTLPDGSVATLAPHSTLDVAAEFTGPTAASRTVRVQGEVFFSVAQQAEAPFSVQTQNTMTRVLGTEFSVRRYPKDSVSRIVVISGKVATTVPGDADELGEATTLTQGMVAIASDSGVAVDRISDLTPYSAWPEGRLVFRDVPAVEVLGIVGRWYGYEFRVKDSTLAQRQVTTTLDGRSPKGVLRAISLLLDAQLSVSTQADGKSVIMVQPMTVRKSAPAKRGDPDSLFPTSEVGR